MHSPRDCSVPPPRCMLCPRDSNADDRSSRSRWAQDNILQHNNFHKLRRRRTPGSIVELAAGGEVGADIARVVTFDCRRDMTETEEEGEQQKHRASQSLSLSLETLPMSDWPWSVPLPRLPSKRHKLVPRITSTSPLPSSLSSSQPCTAAPSSSSSQPSPPQPSAWTREHSGPVWTTRS